MAKKFIQGHIAAIIDDQRLLINLGMEQGVSMGDRFIIFEEGNEIHDPVSGQSLGKLELVKTQIEAVHVQDKMALVMPIHRDTLGQPTVLSATLAQTSTTASSDFYRDRMHVKKTEILGLTQVNSTIAVGDRVRSIKPLDL
jgi:hypothetical protein